MIITAKHATALEHLLADEEANRPYTPVEVVDDETFTELEMAGLARFTTPVKLVPTYLGRELALVLRELYRQGPEPYAESEDEVAGNLVILEGRGIPAPQDWPEGWRWVGSEVIAMLDAAERAGRVGPYAVQPLMDRGLAVRVRDRERKIETYTLSEAGHRVLEIYRAITPNLEISADLAEFIRHTPLGPTESARLPTGSHEEHLLEAMRLVAYSVPNTDVYAFTALGQAVKQTLALGGFGTGDVLTSDILWTLALYFDTHDVPEAGLATLQALGYVDAEGQLLPAGEWALETLRLWRDGPRADVWSFAIEAEEAEVLKTIQALWNKAQTNPEERPTFVNLRREMIDRKIRQYKELLARYGRKLEEMPEKYRVIAQRFSEAKELDRWYDENFDLRESIASLESFDLIATDVDPEGREVFTITEWGQRVIADQTEDERDVTATGVKAITMTRKTFSAPNLEWWQQAKEENLVGATEPTQSGLLYAQLAEHVRRRPHLSKYELEVFHVIPARGMAEAEIYQTLEGKLEPRWIRWALEKLEARHLIDRLPDGNVVETSAGEMLDRALAGVPEGFGNPVNPVLFRVVEALCQVGTLYVKEQRVRVLPRNVDEAIRRSGLPVDVFENALEAARVAGYVGRTSVNEAGLLLLEVGRLMNPGAEVHGLAELEPEAGPVR